MKEAWYIVLFNPYYQVLPPRARVELGAMAIKGYSTFPKLQHCWNLTIRLFSVISRTLDGRVLTPLQRSSRCILQPQPTGQLAILGMPDIFVLPTHMRALRVYVLVLFDVGMCQVTVTHENTIQIKLKRRTISI